MIILKFEIKKPKFLFFEKKKQYRLRFPLRFTPEELAKYKGESKYYYYCWKVLKIVSRLNKPKNWKIDC